MKLFQWSPVIALLLIMLWIRSHHINRLEVFVDEGYHITRAAVVWDFEQHPARFANGKLLLYFWLGLFETDPLIALPVSRLAIVLFSVITGAAVYQLGRQLQGHMAGLVAVGMYALLPLAFFYERMALADSFAAGFMGLVAWRSLIFARKPTTREGILLGILIALALLAKLTMGLIPLLPLLASFIFYQQGKPLSAAILRRWGRLYVPGLCLAAGIVILAWLPTLIPAILAMRSDNPFTLINSYNLQYLNESDPVGTFSEILPMLAAYLHWGLLLGIVIGWVYLLWQEQYQGLFLLGWMVLIVLLSLLAAAEGRTRYYMPLALPFVLILAVAIVSLGRRASLLIRVGLAGLVTIWIAAFALPFALVMMDDPAELSLAEGDWIRYMSGNFSGDALREAAQTLNQLDAESQGFYSTWGTCQILYLYTVREVTCLPPPDEKNDPHQVLEAYLAADWQAGWAAYVVLNGHEPDFEDVENRGWELIARFPRPYIDRPVTVWRVH